MQQPQKAVLRVSVNGVPWQSSPGEELRYYNPSMNEINVQGTSNVRYGPAAGGTKIEVREYSLV